jgi:hypothetical protein
MRESWCAMKIVGSHKYEGRTGETIRFEIEPSSINVMSVRAYVNLGKERRLPFDIIVGAGMNYSVEVHVVYSSASGGHADIQIAGSGGGTDHQQLRQIPGDLCEQTFRIDQK